MIIGNLLETDNPAEKATLVGKYFMTVLLALAIHTVIVMPLLYHLVCHRNPLTVIKAMTQSLITTFGTSSRFVFTHELIQIDKSHQIFSGSKIYTSLIHFI